MQTRRLARVELMRQFALTTFESLGMRRNETLIAPRDFRDYQIIGTFVSC